MNSVSQEVSRPSKNQDVDQQEERLRQRSRLEAWQARYKHRCFLKPFNLYFFYFIVVVQYSLMALVWPLSVLQNPEEMAKSKKGEK